MLNQTTDLSRELAAKVGYTPQTRGYQRKLQLNQANQAQKTPLNLIAGRKV